MAGIKDGQHTRLIAHGVRIGPVYGVGVAPLEFGIGLGTGDEEDVGIERARNGDPVLREVGVDLPRPGCIGVGHGVARNGLAAQTHVIQPLGLGTQIDLDVAQRLAVGQLSKGHGQALVHAGPALQ